MSDPFQDSIRSYANYLDRSAMEFRENCEGNIKTGDVAYKFILNKNEAAHTNNNMQQYEYNSAPPLPPYIIPNPTFTPEEIGATTDNKAKSTKENILGLVGNLIDAIGGSEE